MRILLSGGSGFIGRRIARQAVARGHEVLSFSRWPAGSGSEWHHVQAPIDSPPWTQIERFQPEVLVHAAWEVAPGVYFESPGNPLWVDWSEAFVRGLAARGLRRFVLLGTCLEYQITGQPMRENDTPIAPLSTYACCKDELRRRLEETLPAVSTQLAWARLFYLYGPGEPPSKLCTSLIRRFRCGEPVTLMTPFSVKDYIHVDEVGRALLHIAERGYDGPINVGTGTGSSVLLIAQTIAATLGCPELVQPSERPSADPLFHVVADISRLRALGWSPQVGLEAGVRGLIETSAS